MYHMKILEDFDDDDLVIVFYVIGFHDWMCASYI